MNSQNDNAQPLVAVIGLGNMGMPMALNLISSGYEVIGFDLSPQALEKAENENVKTANSIEEAVEKAQVVVTMLPAGEHVKAAYKDILSSANKGTLFIDSSTIDVTTSREVSESAIEAGFEMIDAPVSGGVPAATSGTLTFMIGGEESTYERAKPILEAMGKSFYYTGAAGNGQVAKVCNNMMLGISMIASCEALNLAKRLGLDPEKFFEVVTNASGQCWSLTAYCPYPGLVPSAPSNNDYKPGFTSAMMLKDLRLAQEAANSSDAKTPLGAAAESIYAHMNDEGYEGLDFSAVMKIIDN